MSTRMKLAFGCYLFILVFNAAWGIMFFLRTEFMPYHAAAAAMSWTEVPPSLQVLILGLMKVFGAASVVLALSLLLLLFVPFRQGASWAKWGIPALLIAHFLGGALAIAYVAQHSAAPLPWGMPIIGFILVAASLVLSIERSGGDARRS